ncbi:MAG: HNH endonuclease signature motif containing protein, partial [Mycobacteriales bacterium]
PGAAHISQDDDGIFHLELPEAPHDPPGGIGPPIEPAPPLPGPHGPAQIRRVRHRPWSERSQPPVPDPDSIDDSSWEPAPPTLAELDYHDWSTDHASAHALISWQFHQQPRAAACPAPAGPRWQPPPPAWTRAGLNRALGRFRTRPAEPPPPVSGAYPFGRRASRHIKLRDQHCTFPGCYRLARACHNDHLTAWPAGPTHIDNGAAECEHHHLCKHHYCTVRKLDDGTLRWTTPTGQHADTPPRALLRGW